MAVAGIDYAGGRPAAAHIRAAGYSFVCRYLSDGGASLPGKLLLPSEVADLQANGIAIVSNWETTGTTALGGFSAGVSDAQAAWAMHTSLGGPANRPIYFSIDWDEAPSQDPAVFAYFEGIASVIGLEQTGAYGGYWPLSRLLDAGLITWSWQTQAWSGGNQDPRINILQDSNAGFIYVDGVECDLDYALTEDFGQWNYQGAQPVSNPPAITKPSGLSDQASEIWDQLLIRWDMLGGHTIVEALAAIGQKLGIDGFAPPA